MRNGNPGICGSRGNKESITYRTDWRIEGSNPTITAETLPLIQRTAISAPLSWQCNELGFWLIGERFLQDVCQSGLSLRHPSRIVFANRVFVVAKKISYVSNGNPALQENARERVPETVRSRCFLKLASKFKNSVDPPAPKVGHRLQPFRVSQQERPYTMFFCAL
jgi:hypothetical protein